MPPVTHDLIEPDARIYGDKQCALADAGGLGVLADRRIDRLVPHLHDLRLGAALFEFQRAQHALDDGLGVDGPIGVGLFQRADIEAAPVVEQSPAAPEPVGATAELEADENVPSLAEVQVALQQCVKDRKVLDAQCEATGEGTEFTCTYSLDGDTPETEREAMIAADGASYVLIDIPEDCQQL